MELISVIVPCFNEQEVLPLFYGEITSVAQQMAEKYKDSNEISFEFIFINDGSADNTLGVLRDMAQKDKRVRYISFSRNFGKEAAMLAGLKASTGDYAVILDADLQHPPRLIPQMYEYVKSGEYDCAATKRISRKGESAVLSFFSRMFYRVINSLSDTQIENSAQDFRLMTRQMVNAILALPEYNRFSKGIFSWVGFNTKYIEVENTQRAAGSSTFNFKRLFSYSLEGIFAFSTAPLRLATVMSAVFLIIAAAIVIKALVCAEPLGGYTATAALICLVGGIQLLCTGIAGEYITKIYTEIKHRPKYIIKETEESRVGGRPE